MVADAGVELDGTGWSAAPANEVVDEIRAAGGEAVACYSSVADETGAAAIVQSTLDAFGRLDIVINNAGIHEPARTDLRPCWDVVEIRSRPSFPVGRTDIWWVSHTGADVEQPDQGTRVRMTRLPHET